MKSYRALCVCLLLIAQAAISAEPGWIERGGKPLVEDTSRRSVAGFGGWLVVTPDVDWEAKWNTPKENTPSFNTADDVRQGETLTILVFFANPRLDKQRRAKVTCDIRVTRPDRTLSTNERGVLCAEGGAYGDSSTVYLSNLVVGFVGEPKDPLGTWVVDVTLHDDNASIVVPLKATFELK